MLLVRLHDDLTPEEKKSIFKSDTKPQNTPNPFREELKEHEAIKFTSMSNSQEQDAMEEGECSPESNKAQDDYCKLVAAFCFQALKLLFLIY